MAKAALLDVLQQTIGKITCCNLYFVSHEKADGRHFEFNVSHFIFSQANMSEIWTLKV